MTDEVINELRKDIASKVVAISFGQRIADFVGDLMVGPNRFKLKYLEMTTIR